MQFLMKIEASIIVQQICRSCLCHLKRNLTSLSPNCINIILKAPSAFKKEKVFLFCIKNLKIYGLVKLDFTF